MHATWHVTVLATTSTTPAPLAAKPGSLPKSLHPLVTVAASDKAVCRSDLSVMPQYTIEAAAADVVSEADQQPQQLLAQLLPVQLLVAVAESKTTGEGTESPDATAGTCS